MAKRELSIDWFAGGGGASSGIRAALGRPIDIALNHNAKAVAMHRINHPETRHIVGNAWDYAPSKVVRPGTPVGDAWFSPDCTFHSNARGGKPFRDTSYANRLRGLPHVVGRWARELRPRRIYVENVREMIDWGPLVDGKPCKRRKGAHFRRWCKMFQDLGYQIDMRELYADDYGAPTIRKRLFVVMRCDGEDIVFPEPTHGNGLLPVRTAADCIDWSDLGQSIFERERELAEATKRRIARGMVKYVINAENPFIVPVGFGERQGQAPRIHGIDEPLSTIMAERNRHMLIHPFVTPVKTWGGGGNEARDIELPMRTTTSSKGGEHALVSAFVEKWYTSARQGADIAAPLGTISAGGQHHGVVNACLVQHQGGYFEAKQCNAPPITGPMPSIMAKGCQTQLLTSMTGNDRDKAHRVAAFIMSYYGTEQNPSIHGPVPTIRTKDHLAIVTAHGDPITDIRMRMFKPRELYNAQSFRPDYIIDRGLDDDGNEVPLTQTEQVRFVGNSVPPVVAEAIVRANREQSRQGRLL